MGDGIRAETQQERYVLTKILSRWDADTVLWEGAAGTVKEAVYKALEAHANLRDANLRDANLRGADLRDADLGGADLGGANLRGADLRGADLGGADLGGANLGGADLRDADLRGANIGGADLGGADLTTVRDDLWAVLSAAPAEVPALIAALREGRIDGSCYQGVCACLVGTIANARGCNYTELAPVLEANSGRPAEAFFTAIRPGETPDTNQAAKLALAWTEEWYARMQDAFAPKVVA